MAGAVALAVAMITGVVVMCATMFADIGELGDSLRKIDLRYYLLVPLFVATSYGIQGLRWHFLTRGVVPDAPGILTFVKARAAGTVFNVVLPGFSGDVASAYLLQRFHGVPMGSSLAASFFGLILGLIAAALFVLTVVVLFTQVGDVFLDQQVGFVFRVAALLTVACAVFALSSTALRLVEATFQRLAASPRLRPGGRPARALGFLHRHARFAHHSFVLMHRRKVRNYAGTVGITALQYVNMTLLLYLGFRSIGVTPDPVLVLVFYFVFLFCLVLGAVMPGAMASLEFAAIWYWGAVSDVAPTDALAALLIARAWAIIELVVSGALVVAFLRRVGIEEVRRELATRNPFALDDTDGPAATG